MSSQIHKNILTNEYSLREESSNNNGSTDVENLFMRPAK
jgi:hypothetical protein